MVNVAEALKATGLYEIAEKGKKIADNLTKDSRPFEPEYVKKVQALTDEEYYAFVIYKAHIAIDTCGFSVEDSIEALPRAIKNQETLYFKKFNRSLNV